MDFHATLAPRRGAALWIVVCAGVLGMGANIASFVARTRPWETPERPSLATGLYLGASGLIAGVLVSYLLLKLFGFEHSGRRSFWIWLMVGLLYGVGLPVVTGALVPPGTVLLEIATGGATIRAALPYLLDSLFYMPWSALTQGFLGMPAGLLAGALLTVITWAIDAASSSKNDRVAVYGAPAIALAVVLVTVGLIFFGPPSWLYNWGIGIRNR